MKNNQENNFSSILNNLNSKEDRKQATERLMSGISADESKQLFEILADREKLSAILSSPAAQAIMNKINGHK